MKIIRAKDSPVRSRLRIAGGGEFPGSEFKFPNSHSPCALAIVHPEVGTRQSAHSFPTSLASFDSDRSPEVVAFAASNNSPLLHSSRPPFFALRAPSEPPPTHRFRSSRSLSLSRHSVVLSFVRRLHGSSVLPEIL